MWIKCGKNEKDTCIFSRDMLSSNKWGEEIPQIVVEWQRTATEEKEIAEMALTRKMLAAMDIPSEKIEEIIAAHTETTDALKDQLDSVTATQDKLDKANAKINELKKLIADADTAGWEKKYNDMKAEFDSYKADIENKAVRGAKESAYKQLLVDAGVSEKRVGAILKLSDLDSITLDKEGKIKDADKLKESVKAEWSEFIVTEDSKGAETPKPAESSPSTPSAPSRAAQLVAQYRNEHYGIKEG